MAKAEKEQQMTIAEAESLVVPMGKQVRAFARIQEVLQVARSAEGIEATARRKLKAVEEKIAEAEAESITAIDKFKAATASAAQKYKKEVDRRQGELVILNKAATEAQTKIDTLRTELAQETTSAQDNHATRIATRTAEIAALEDKKQRVEKDLDKLVKRIAG